LTELGATVGDALLAPHRSYLQSIRPLLAEGLVKGMAHITGGGITENLPRVLPDACAAEIDQSTWVVPPVFELIREHGHVATDEMFKAFNMGIGLVVVCAETNRKRVFDLLRTAGEPGAATIGRIVTGHRDVRYLARQ
jgi:phosphoribosylformylglycinamidine cyclo-ligase